MSGPRWLSLDEGQWPPSIEPHHKELPGLKQKSCLLTTPVFSCDEVYLRFSSYERLVRVMTYVLRWRNKSREARERRHQYSELDNDSRSIQSIRPLLPSEIIRYEARILSLIQKERFPSEYRRLEGSSGAFKRGTCFDKLGPFMGTDGLIRVGGRLEKFKLAYGQKHPIILPQNHHITRLIIRHFHESNLHAGIQTTHYTIRGKFFIIHGKSQVRQLINRCIKCLQQRPPVGHAQMASLPEARVNESTAFEHTGVDFFGPFNIKEKAHRNKSFLKCYGCVFIYLASKAVHVELAIDLSTTGFLAALRRFIGRRGVPPHVYSDNGTNFVGANKDLGEIYKLFDTEEFQRVIGNYAASRRIEWHFNPPSSPHFGGLWEAMVNSFKHHLKRIVDSQLTYEQLNTLLIEIEGILKSRPLCVLSADPNDPFAITPAYLLIGRPFNALPEESLLSVPDNRLSTYKFVTKARQNFWEKWQKEYLHELQVRQKWANPTAELKLGDVVLLIEDNVACGKWPLDVIVEVFPGSDGVVRIVSVKTVNGVYKRNITRLCVLPLA